MQGPYNDLWLNFWTFTLFGVLAAPIADAFVIFAHAAQPDEGNMYYFDSK